MRGMSARVAMFQLASLSKRCAPIIAKTLNGAMASAENMYKMNIDRVLICEWGERLGGGRIQCPSSSTLLVHCLSPSRNVRDPAEAPAAHEVPRQGPKRPHGAPANGPHHQAHGGAAPPG